MKYSKTGILKKKVGPASDILQEEAKKMEEKLSELKDFMIKEKEKRESAPRMKDGAKWRSSATNKPISGYADLVLSQKGKIPTKPKPAKKEEFLPASSLLEPKAESQIKLPLEAKDEVLAFLTSIGMEKYHKVFLENGIEEIDILLELNEAHLTNMGVPLGHRLKIIKKLKEQKEAKGDKKTEASSEAGKENLGPGATHEICVGGDEELPDGEFNEAESYNMFKEAIDCYRTAGSPTKHKVRAKDSVDYPKKVRFVEELKEEMIPKNVKGLFYEGSWVPAETVSEKFEESTGTNAFIIKDRKSCWNCYKIFEAGSVFQAYEKDFCGKPCSSSYFENTATSCFCGTKYIKNLGSIDKGVSGCSKECVEKAVNEKKELKETGGSFCEKEVKDSEKAEKNNEEVEEDGDEYEDEFINFGIFIDPSTGDPVSR